VRTLPSGRKKLLYPHSGGREAENLARIEIIFKYLTELKKYKPGEEIPARRLAQTAKQLAKIRRTIALPTKYVLSNKKFKSL
jgi:hypothetical protein